MDSEKVMAILNEPRSQELMRSTIPARMVLISVRPKWAKLIDFETAIPSAVEQLVKEQGLQSRG